MRSPSRAVAALALLALGACGEADEPPRQVVPADPVLSRIAAPVERGTVTLVRMSAEGDGYAFEPADVSVRPGDVVRFVLSGSQPESVAFDTTGLPAPAVDFLRRQGLVRGPLLTRPGQVYDASFHDAPPGRYLFFSVPHASFGMRGAVVVEPEPPR